MGERDEMDRILATARETLGMQIAYFSQLDAGEQLIHAVNGDPGGLAIADGTRVAVDDTYCRRMLDEAMPSLVPDADQEAALAGVRGPATPVAYLGVPLQLSTGRVYGTLCCASEQPRPELRDRDVAVMRMLAGLLADVIERPGAQAGPTVREDGQVARLSFWVVATPRAVRASRRALDSLADWIPPTRLSDLHLIVSELVTNSVRHAEVAETSAVAIDVRIAPDGLRGVVTDTGIGFDPAAVPPPEVGRSGGWGLHIVERLTRMWGIERPDGRGVKVTFELDLA